uniref:Type I restriction-modification system, specificity subunit S n=1 Tax=uncultured bacterium A1Q1_fos_493 TaxID=1256577 RepID=L7VXT6_9BACT|nr:type I restriction-modification system, specificity subunit S [uncultured bacterium A1Q1_fos_493]
MSEWKDFNLEELADIHNYVRVPLSKMQRDEKQGQYPYYGASGIIDYIDEYLFDGEYVLISEDGENLKSRQTPIAFKATGQFWVNNHAHIVKGKQPWLNDLLIYFFQNLDLSPYITGAVQPKLNKENLLSIPISLPKNEIEQQAIAAVLSSLDDKIDLLHRQNKTLEALAQTLFRHWFVDGAENNVFDTLESLGDFSNGKSRPPQVENGPIPIYGGNGILGFTDIYNSEGESIVIGRVGAYCGSLYFENRPIWVTDNALLATPKRADFSKYLFYLLLSLNLNSMAEGSSHPLLTQKLLNSIEIPVHTETAILQFNEVVEPMFAKRFKNLSQIKTLEVLRDTLLPKLMSGEVRVQL